MPTPNHGASGPGGTEPPLRFPGRAMCTSSPASAAASATANAPKPEPQQTTSTSSSHIVQQHPDGDDAWIAPYELPWGYRKWGHRKTGVATARTGIRGGLPVRAVATFPG